MIWLKLMDGGWLQCQPNEVRAILSTQHDRPDLWERGIRSQVAIVGETDGWYFSVHTADEIMELVRAVK